MIALPRTLPRCTIQLARAQGRCTTSTRWVNNMGRALRAPSLHLKYDCIPMLLSVRCMRGNAAANPPWGLHRRTAQTTGNRTGDSHTFAIAPDATAILLHIAAFTNPNIYNLLPPLRSLTSTTWECARRLPAECAKQLLAQTWFEHLWAPPSSQPNFVAEKSMSPMPVKFGGVTKDYFCQTPRRLEEEADLSSLDSANELSEGEAGVPAQFCT